MMVITDEQRRRTMRVMRSAGRRAAAVAAMALALAGCGMGGDSSDAQQPPEVSTLGAETPTPSPTPTEESASPDASEDPFADAARTTSWASDEAMKIDKDGNGTIPAASLEADLVDLFANKFDMSVKEAKCEQDMTVTDWSGFESCNVVDEEMTYFGTIELIDHKDNMVEYEVMFPGIDKDDVDF